MLGEAPSSLQMGTQSDTPETEHNRICFSYYFTFFTARSRDYGTDITSAVLELLSTSLLVAFFYSWFTFTKGFYSAFNIKCCLNGMCPNFL